MLDIGIGGGRTTAYLKNLAKKYIGIDYSENLVDAAKKKFPDADLRVADARDLSEFNANQFDFIVFSFNGIDYVGLDDRNKILNEINRVLKPGGIFFFSTHNKNHDSFNVSPWLNPSNSLLINLKTFIKLLPYLFRHFAKKTEEVIADNYAVINNCAHNYSLMTFHTTPVFLQQQLNSNGFNTVEFLNKKGDKTENLDEWIYVTCKKG